MSRIDEMLIIKKIDLKDRYELETWFAEDIIPYTEQMIDQLERAILRLRALKEKYAN